MVVIMILYLHKCKTYGSREFTARFDSIIFFSPDTFSTRNNTIQRYRLNF